MTYESILLNPSRSSGIKLYAPGHRNVFFNSQGNKIPKVYKEPLTRKTKKKKRVIVAGASSNGTFNAESNSDTLNDPLSFMGNREGQVKTVLAGQRGSK